MAEVKIGETVLSATNNYQFNVYENGTYTVTATDALGNVGTHEFTVSNIADLTITDTELNNAVSIGSRQRNNILSPYTKTITINKNNNPNGVDVNVVEIRYISTIISQDVNVNSFKNSDGTYTSTIWTGITPHTVQVINSSSTDFTVTDGATSNYYYVYYKVEKTVGDKTVTEEKVVRVRPGQTTN